VTSDGGQGQTHLCLEDVLPPSLSGSAVRLRLSTVGVLTGLASQPFVIRMCPPLTVKNMAEYVPRLALGAANGNVQVLNVSTGRVERELAVHTFPVRGLEWASLHAILSHACQNSTGSGKSM